MATSRKTLRPYQESCVQAHYSFFADNEEGHPLFVVPTGGGKSLIIAEFIRRTLAEWPETRILVVTHVRELIVQNHAEFVEHWGDDDNHPAGIYSAGLGAREHHARVLFAGIQSIYDKAEAIGHVDLVLIDEAHLVPKAGFGRYRRYLMDLAAINMAAKVIGYTATPYRLDGGFLHETCGKDDSRIFTHIAYDVRLEVLIDGGWLVPLVAKKPDHEIDTSRVHTVAGEFKLDELEAAAMNKVTAAVAEVVATARKAGRKSWLFFAIGIAHAEMIVDELHAHGVDAEAVFGHTPKADRDAIVERFRGGDLTALVNVGVLTTGFNAPRCDLMAVLRPTQSTSLYVQMMGRGMRTFDGKDDCLVLDYGGNVRRHGPVNDVKPRKPGAKGDGEPPVKVCPECKSYVPISARECPDCGFVFQIVQHIHDSKAAHDDPIQRVGRPEPNDVTRWSFLRHEKVGKPPSMRVVYQCGMRTYSEWVCFEHEGYARQKAAQWWFRAGGRGPVPQSVDEAIERAADLPPPARIHVKRDGKYDSVTKVEFAAPPPPEPQDVVDVHVPPPLGYTVDPDESIPF